MRRLLVLGLGLAMVIAPNRIVDAAERVAFENPATGRLRSWTLPMARLEGLLFVWLFGRHPEQTSVLKRPFAILGLFMALVPRQSLDVGLGLAYENPDELEVKPWVRHLTRLLGACYIIVGVGAMRATGRTDDASATNN